MRLYLLRHARADVGDGRETDAQRRLTPDGRRDAAAVGAWLARRPHPPRHVLCSSARRTVETMERVLAALPDAPTTRVSEDLYLASAWKIFELTRHTTAPVDSLLLVAHNPGVAELAARLAAHGDAAAIQSLSRRFVPATLAEIELPATRWVDLDLDSGTLVSHFVA